MYYGFSGGAGDTGETGALRFSGGAGEAGRPERQGALVVYRLPDVVLEPPDEPLGAEPAEPAEPRGVEVEGR